MTGNDTSRLSATAAALRLAFDRAFAEPPAPKTAAFEDVLAIRIATDPFALVLSEAAGLFVDRTIVPVPSPVAELLGVASLRGRVAAVYDLGVLLGYPAAPAPRWFVLAREPGAIGLAFEAFEAHARIPRASFAETETDAAGSEHVRGAVQVDGVLRPVIRIASVLDAVARRHVPTSSPRSGDPHG
jgi:chemotaxis signal transduction protein